MLSEDSIPEEVAGEAEGLLEAVLQGRNSVVLALGQSGSGKTHTMAGDISPLDRTRTRITGKLASAMGLVCRPQSDPLANTNAPSRRVSSQTCLAKCQTSPVLLSLHLAAFHT